MSRFLLLLFFALILLPVNSNAANVSNNSIQVNGVNRTYTLYLPDQFNSSQRYPIVFMLHGGGGTGEKIAKQSGLGELVDEANFIAVFPDSYNHKQWNDGRETTADHGDDVGFLVTLARALAAKYGDPHRVFVAGASNGGMMTQRLACEATDAFAAYTSAIANLPVQESGNCHPSHPVPMLFFNSTTDPLMPWGGGEIRQGRNGLGGGHVISTPQTISFWSRTNQCGQPNTQMLPKKTNDGTHVKFYNFGSCGMLFYEVQGGGHTWPGSSVNGYFARRLVGEPTREIDANTIMLNFFRRYGF